MNKQDGGGIVPPNRTGKKATLMMTVQIMVEVDETDDRNNMIWQAKEQLRKRIVPAKGFEPFRSQCETIHPEVEVEDLKYQTEVGYSRQW